MGVQIAELLPKREVELIELSGKKIAIDAFNTLFQFLSIIRDRITGEPLRDHSGRITSHLSGIFYRNTNLIEFGVKPIYVFDGPPPEFKKKTIEEREARKEEAVRKWEEAIRKGEPAIKYAQATSRLSNEMIDDAKKLLDYMGIPWIVAKSEGEAQCSYMCGKGEVYAVGSQDHDSLLFGSPRLIRNLSISGKRKLPGKEVYVEVKPELIELENALKNLGISREQLILIGLLVGTDYNKGIKGIGPKTALKLVNECKNLETLLKKVEWESEFDAEDIFNFFLDPPVTNNYKIEWKEPKPEKIIKFMVEEHDFSRERVEKVVEKLRESFYKEKQTSLGGWLKK